MREGWIWERGSEREIGEEDQRGESLGVWLGSLFIEPSYVTRLELVEEKLSKSGKNFDKVSSLLFFAKRRKFET